MVTIVTRAGKGTALSYDEMDANFVNLNTKLEPGSPATDISFTPSGLVTSLNVQEAIADAATASKTSNIPAGNIIATNTQDAINELDTKKISASQVQLQSPIRFTAGGTVNIITGILNPVITSYTAGLRITTIVSGANTVVAPTISLNDLAVVTIKKQGSAGKVALVIGDYNQFGPAIFEYDGVDFVLLNPLNGAFFGYAAGSGGTVTQATSKSTTVTLNKLCGLITTHPESLAAGAAVVFAVNNTTMQIGDVVVPMLQNSVQGNNMLVHVWAAASGVFYLNLKNTSGAPQAFAVDIYFTIIKGATS